MRIAAAPGDLAESAIFFTERWVNISYVIGPAIIAAALSSGASAQGAPSGDVPRAQFITTMDGEFGKMDADKDGKVTRAEIEAYDRTVALANARARAEAMFDQLDVDKNHQLSLAEFMKLVTAPPPVDGRPLIAKLDLNHDGVISAVEYRAGKLGYFDQIDTDKNGVVSVAEMKAAGVVK